MPNSLFLTHRVHKAISCDLMLASAPRCIFFFPDVVVRMTRPSYPGWMRYGDPRVLVMGIQRPVGPHWEVIEANGA